MESLVRFVLFAAVAALITLLIHLYLYRRLFADTSEDPRWRRAGKAVMAALALPLMLSFSLTRLLPMDATFAMATATWMWMGAATYLMFSFWVLGGTRLMAGWLARSRPASPSPAAALASAAPGATVPVDVPAEPPAAVDVERRRFLARATAGGALLATSGVTGYGMWRAFQPPVVSEVAVRLPGLPRALDGYSIVHLSDIHVGPVIRRQFMQELVARCNALRPDLVCITGDLVDGQVASLMPAVSALSGLGSRHGTYFVTGNHEYYWDHGAWAEALERMDIHVLRNRHVRIGDAAASFDLVGVDDWSAVKAGFKQTYDLDSALAGRAPERASVLLAHQPSNWREAAKAGLGLQLSGHTHGGQFFPFTLAVSAIWEHDAGHFQEGDRHLYVSRGTGFWGPPLRVGSPPEIVKVTLVA